MADFRIARLRHSRTRVVKPNDIVTTTCLILFFFSSRRRHTRFDCDWSSDVCSSDLVQLDLGASAKARDAAERAQRLATTTRNQACEAEALNVGGDLALYGGHVRESIAPFSKAASISERLGDRRGHARALLNLGYAHADLGDTDESERLYTSALALWRLGGPTP